MSDGSFPTTAIKGGGLVQDPFDPKDHYYQAQASTQPPPSLNLREDHAQFASEIYDQGQTSSCTANAAAAALWYEENAGGCEEFRASAGPSRLFIYWNARGGYENDDHNIEDVKDTGSNMREAMKGIAKVGACSEKDWPFIVERVNSKPCSNAYKNSAHHRITSYYRLDPDRPDKDDGKLNPSQKDQIGFTLLMNLKKCLTEGFPVAFGFWYYIEDGMFDEAETPFVLKDVWNMSDSKFPRHTFPENLPDDLRIKDENGKIKKPGHSVLATGYDESRKQILVQNSWGQTWSGDGTFWMPYAWITDFAATNDFWTIRTTQTPPDESPKLWQDVHQEIMAAA